jgi:hypothetical protein
MTEIPRPKTVADVRLMLNGNWPPKIDAHPAPPTMGEPYAFGAISKAVWPPGGDAPTPPAVSRETRDEADPDVSRETSPGPNEYIDARPALETWADDAPNSLGVDQESEVVLRPKHPKLGKVKS